jgi:large subunit ribosomal protein L24
MHVKKNDIVVIISGKERGERGRVLRVLKGAGKVIVERRNLIKRHTKPNSALGREGGIIEREAPIHASNVALYSPKLDGPVRTQVRFLGEGGATFTSQHEALASYTNPPKRIRKVRVAAKTGEVFE